MRGSGQDGYGTNAAVRMLCSKDILGPVDIIINAWPMTTMPSVPAQESYARRWLHSGAIHQSWTQLPETFADEKYYAAGLGFNGKGYQNLGPKAHW